MPSTDTRELVGELTLAMAEADTMLGWARVRYSVLRDLRDALLRSPVERGEGERKKSDWANPLEAAFYWMSPGADASPEEREEYERDRLFVSAALSTVRLDRQEPDVRDGWEVEHGVICVTCPDCAFTFGAEHRDAGGGYTCPLCASPPAPVEGTRERVLNAARYALGVLEQVNRGHSHGVATYRAADALRSALAALPVQGSVPYRHPTTYCPAHGTRFWCEPAGDESHGYCSRCALPVQGERSAVLRKKDGQDG